MKKDIKNMIKVAERLGWTVKIEDDGTYFFSKNSPQGQDFWVVAYSDDNDLEVIVEELNKRCENFDVSEEAYNWLDSFGHGTNGAPYDMRDVYEDMGDCLNMLEGLVIELKNIE